MDRVSVIIPNWNGAKLLPTCLKSLREQTWQKFELIIVDNGSTDGSLTSIKKHYPTAKVVTLDENKGFASAVNIGIHHAKGQYIILINNDTKVDKHCIQALVLAAEHKKEYGLFATKMLDFYNPKLIDSAGTFITSVGHANGIGWKEHDGPEYNQPKEVFMVSGGGCLIKRSVIEKIGLFDEDFFAYFEDVDFCLRAQLKGIKCWYVPKAIIYHIHKATSRRVPAFTEYLQFRNMTQTIIKDFPKDLLLKDWNWLKIILVNIHTVWYLAQQGYLLPALKAELYIVVHLQQLLKKRALIQQANKITIKYIHEQVVPKHLKLRGKEII